MTSPYGISVLVSAISDDVVAALAAKGYPPLTDGKILLGEQHRYELSAPPRVIMTPDAGIFGALDTQSSSYTLPPGTGGNTSAGVGVSGVKMTRFGGGYTSAPTVVFTGGGGTGAAATATVVNQSVSSVTITNQGSGYTSAPAVSFTGGGGANATAVSKLRPTLEFIAQSEQRSLYTETIVFECRCWGVTPANNNVDTDFDWTQQLYQQIIRSCRNLAIGSFQLVNMGGGRWTEASVGETQLLRDGREFVFRFGIDVPVLDELLAYVSPPPTLQATVSEGNSSGDNVVVG